MWRTETETEMNQKQIGGKMQREKDTEVNTHMNT